MSHERYRDWLEEALDDYFAARDLYNLKGIVRRPFSLTKHVKRPSKPS
jgi:hypothetical protein